MSDLRKKILLVDDEEETLVFLSSILRRHDYDVVFTSKSTEVVELAKQNKPDVIILDIVMPQLDGGEVAVALENDPATKNIPIVFLSGIVDKKEEFLDVKAGRQYELVAKPVNEEELLAVIKKVLIS